MYPDHSTGIYASERGFSPLDHVQAARPRHADICNFAKCDIWVGLAQQSEATTQSEIEATQPDISPRGQPAASTAARCPLGPTSPGSVRGSLAPCCNMGEVGSGTRIYGERYRLRGIPRRTRITT
jgi:hypothetical protein